ncbi:MAG: hypothetical protein LBD24_09205 [Spirochaetaceae bacterium]|nr:hypothetical protein [Spirochaetaceae bacterium]
MRLSAVVDRFGALHRKPFKTVGDGPEAVKPPAAGRRLPVKPVFRGVSGCFGR